MNFSDLHEQQKDAINFILNNKVGCIAPECGSGKTVIGLTAFLGIKKLITNHLPRMLVISTKMGIEETWKNEHLKWEHLKKLNVLILNGTKKQREQKMDDDCEQPADILCVSYNNLQWLCDYQKNNDSYLYDFIFADEGSCLKGHDSKWRKALEQLSTHAEYKIISTATPAPHDAIDYWGLCKYLDNGMALASPTITDFRHRFCRAIPLPNRVGQRYELRRGASEEIKKRVAHLFYSFATEKEIPLEVIDKWEQLSPHSIKTLRTVETEQCLNSVITTETGQLDTAESLDALSLANKLTQMANGFVYVDQKLRLSEDTLQKMTERELRTATKKKKGVITLFNDRIRLFKEMVRTIRFKHYNLPVAIAYLFKHDLEVLKEAFPDGVADTEPNIVERWNAGEIPYLFLQYARSSKSLNLQQGSNILAVYSPTWNWEHDYQIVRRLARQGQPRDRVYVYRLWIKGTVDEQKYEVLKERGEGHRTFQNLIADRAQRSRIG